MSWCPLLPTQWSADPAHSQGLQALFLGGPGTCWVGMIPNSALPNAQHRRLRPQPWQDEEPANQTEVQSSWARAVPVTWGFHSSEVCSIH